LFAIITRFRLSADMRQCWYALWSLSFLDRRITHRLSCVNDCLFRLCGFLNLEHGWW
jgi:hypothetical protein